MKYLCSAARGRCSAGLIPALAAVFALAACSSGTTKTPDLHGTSVRAGALVLTVPRGFDHYGLRGGIYRAGTRPPVLGQVVTDYRLKAHSPLRTKGVLPESSYRNRVVLELGVWNPLGPLPRPFLQMPLSLHERWVQRQTATGTLRYGFLGFKGQEYQVRLWIGRSAPPRDRAALLRALGSVRPAS